MCDEGIDEGIIAAAEADHMAAMELSQICAEQDERIAQLEAEKEAIRDFAQWLTGCGYDFAQHEYFIKNRKLLCPPTEDE